MNATRECQQPVPVESNVWFYAHHCTTLLLDGLRTLRCVYSSREIPDGWNSLRYSAGTSGPGSVPL